MNSGWMRWVSIAACFCALVSPAAVGVGTGGTGLKMAYVRGSLSASGGHVAVNGIAFASGGASVTLNGVHGRGLDDLRDGMVAGIDGQVDATGTQGIAQTIAVTRVALGNGYRVGTGGTGLKLAGLLVTPDTGVVLDGMASLGEIVDGDRLEVYGYTDGVSGNVRATRIARVPPDGRSELHGTITAIGAGTVTINGVVVDDSHATLGGFDGAPAVGDRAFAVGVDSASAFIADRVTAEHDDDHYGDAEEGEIVDAIETVIAPGRFLIDGIEVDATSASYQGGTVADLAAGRVVHVHGSFVDSVLVATAVTFDDGGSEVEGTIAAVTGYAAFVVHGVTVDASAAHLSGGTVSDIAVGRRVEVHGARGKDGVLRAARVEFDDAGGGSGSGSDSGSGSGLSAAEIEGRVTSVTALGQFVVRSTLVDARSAKVVGGALASVVPGMHVEVSGQMSGGVLVARRLSIGG